METVSVTREFDADPSVIRNALEDRETYMRAGGFDSITVDGDTVTIENGVGIATMELEVKFVSDPDHVLVYRQVDGIFKEMETRVSVSETASGSAVTMTTDFEIAIDLVGGLLDATVIKRQRRREINAQFDWLESLVN